VNYKFTLERKIPTFAKFARNVALARHNINLMYNSTIVIPPLKVLNSNAIYAKENSGRSVT